MSRDPKQIREDIISAGYMAVEQLIKVAKEGIKLDEGDIAADKLKNVAASKKMAIFDAFEILSRIEAEKEAINQPLDEQGRAQSKQGFAERNSASKK